MEAYPSEETLAAEIMSREILFARRDTTIEEALKILVNSRITGMPVLDAQGRMIGVVSEYDLLRQLSRYPRLSSKVFQKPIKFTKVAESIQEDTPLSEVVTRFINRKFRRLPVLDRQGRLVGIITRRDLMRVFYYRAKLR